MATFTATNTTGITLADQTVELQSLNFYGLSGTVTDVSVTLTGLTHTFPADLDMLLIGDTVPHNLEFWSDIGPPDSFPGGNDLTNANFVISDAGATALPTIDAVPVSGTTYKPADYDTPAETGSNFGFGLGSASLNHPAGSGSATFASAFGGAAPNFGWALFIADDAAGDTGTLASWGLTITTNSNAVAVTGTSGADTLNVTFTSANSGTYSLNGARLISFSGVTSFSFDGAGGSDTLNITYRDLGTNSYTLAGNTISSPFPAVTYNNTEAVNLVHSGGASATFNYTAPTTVPTSIAGGIGTDTIEVFNTQTYDFTAVPITSVEALVYGGSGTSQAFFNSSQIGTGKIASVTGSSSTDVLQVVADSNIDLSGVNFTSWTSNDIISLTGSATGETIIGSSKDDNIYGGGGGDTLSGGGGNDFFNYKAATDIASGESIDGGAGTDTIAVVNAQTYDFTGVGITGIEGLFFTTAVSSAAIFKGSQLGVGKIASISGFLGADSLIVNADGNVDLSGLTFSSWTSGTDTITINGTAAGESLTGSSQNDIITGGGGADTLSGGAGNDTFVFQSPGDGTDMITDFTPGGDLIQLSKTGFSLAASGSLANAGVSFVLGTAATGPGHSVIYDNDGNLFWDADGTGAQPQVMLAHLGVDYTSSTSLGGNTDWLVSATGDFNHDGTGDIIWRSNSSGAELLWFMANGQMASSVSLGGNTDWQVAATGDFNHDGTTDIVWRSNSSGQDLLWTMGANGQPSATTNIGGNLDWKPVATGDFNHDGTTDIIWRSNSSGQDLLWLMNNGQMTQTINLGGNTDWSPVATGDFNHDGTSDIIWRSASTGQDLLWIMGNNGQPASTINLGGNLDWKPVATGDFDRDGTTDIVWRSSSSGTDILWTMANGQPRATEIIGGNLDWQPVATGDFNHDGADDIIWHSTGSGADLLWSMGAPHQAITANDFAIA